MRVVIEKTHLKEAVEKLSSVIEKRASLPVLRNYLIELKKGSPHITIKATNLEVFMSVNVPVVETDLFGEDSVVLVVDADKLTDIAKNITGHELTLKEEQGKLIVKSTRSTFRLNTVPAEDFPEFPNVIEPDSSIPAYRLQDAIDRIGDIIPNDLSNIGGLYIDKQEDHTNFVATNGHILGLIKSTQERVGSSYLIQKKALKPLSKLLKGAHSQEIKIGQDDSLICMQGDNWTLWIRKLEAEFPDYRAVIPSPSDMSYKAVLSKSEFLDALKELSAMADQSVFPVKLTFTEKYCVMSITDPEFGEGQVEAKVQFNHGEQFEIAFNFKYLVQALEGFDEDFIELFMNDDESPVFLRAQDSPDTVQVFWLIMPMRL